jgi:hypothetical protein
VFNDGVNKIPGLYNDKSFIDFKILSGANEQFDIFNLTAAGRVKNLERHFDQL